MVSRSHCLLGGPLRDAADLQMIVASVVAGLVVVMVVVMVSGRVAGC